MNIFNRDRNQAYTNEAMVQHETTTLEEIYAEDEENTMTENPWLPIDTMPLSTVGTEVDVREDRRLHSGVTVSGIRYERDVIEEQFMFGETPTLRIGPIDMFTITLTTGSLHLTPSAEWRPHA